MECAVCGIRSSTGNCTECHALLCEECAIVCESCGKLVCPDHVNETRTGRQLCKACVDARRARRKQERDRHHHHHATPADQAAEVGEDEVVEMPAVLAASAHRGPEPWQWVVGLAILSLLSVLVLLVVPGWRRIPLGAASYIPTVIVPLLVAAIGAVWAVIGLIRIEYDRDRKKIYGGMGALVVAVALASVVHFTDPARAAERAAREAEELRLRMSPEELEAWREQQLRRFDRQGQ